MLNRRTFIQIASASSSGWGLFARPASAQTALEQARIVCGFPGSAIDAMARHFSERLRETYAKAPFVDLKPGAGGRIAVEAAARAAPDGSTILFSPSSMLLLYPHVYGKLSYDPLEDLLPVTPLADVAYGIFVGPSVPESIDTLPAYLAWAKANPPLANYGISAVGSGPHLIAASLARQAGVPLTMVNYKSAAAALTDVLGRQIGAIFSTHPTMIEQVKAGRVRMLAVSSRQRLAQLPAVPTFAEAGFPQLTLGEWFGVFLPKGTPAGQAQRLNTLLRAAAQTPEIGTAFAGMALTPATLGLEDTASRMRAEHAAWGALVRSIGFKPLD